MSSTTSVAYTHLTYPSVLPNPKFPLQQHALSDVSANGCVCSLQQEVCDLLRDSDKQHFMEKKKNCEFL